MNDRAISEQRLLHEFLSYYTNKERNGELCFVAAEIKQHFADLLSAQPTIEATPKEVPRRVLWAGWKGYRDTRYRCPNCEKPVKNDDVYCHRCGQKLMFPHIDFTPYVEGQKQELIVRWDDETN